MITWREEGERGRDHRYVALLGEVEVGHVEWSGSGHWSWRSDLPPASKSGYHEKRDAAKVALAEAVGRWCARAGLVRQLPEPYPATTSTTATHPTEMRGWIKEPTPHD